MADKQEAPSVWHQGKATISILQRHIDEAMEKNSSHCATAEAIREQVPEARFISVDLQTIRWTDSKKGLRYVFVTIQGDGCARLGRCCGVSNGESKRSMISFTNANHIASRGEAAWLGALLHW
jgi:hypothetical protein